MTLTELIYLENPYSFFHIIASNLIEPIVLIIKYCSHHQIDLNTPN